MPILLSCLGLIAGIVLADFCEASLRALFYGLIALFASLIVVHFVASQKSSLAWMFAVTTFLFFATIGLWLHKKALPIHTEKHYTHIATKAPETIFLEIKEVLKPTSYQTKYLGSVLAMGGQSTTGYILLNISKDSLDPSPIEVGARFYSRGRIMEVPVPRNPYQFDYGAYLKRKRVYGQLSVTQEELLPSQSSATGLRVEAARFRKSLQNKLQSQGFTPNQLAIINALILGQRQGIDREMSQQYAAAGMMHILAVSGLHVGIILLLLRFISRPLAGFRLRFARSGIIIMLIWLFAILTGLSPSVLRAATMFSFLEASTFMGSKKETHNALIASAFVLLLFDPLLIYQVGFQLSYAAVIAILWIQPWLAGLFEIKNKFLHFIYTTATVTTAAQLGVMPLSLFYFHQFPGLFLLSNILIIPLLGFLLGMGIAVVVLAGLDLLPDVLVTSFGYVIDLLNGFIGWVAAQEAFVLQHIYVSVTVMMAMYFLILSLISYLKKGSYYYLISAFLGTLLFLGSLSFEKAKSQKSEFIIFHKSKQTLLGIVHNNQLRLETEDRYWNFTNDSRIKSYWDHSALDSIHTSNLSNVLSFKKKNILVIDSLGVYKLKGFAPDYILLTQSPNVHLERIINLYPGITIIADGNNYKSDIDRWSATCLQKKIPFHSTYEKGAFILE